jgi:hypothetical protein
VLYSAVLRTRFVEAASFVVDPLSHVPVRR